MKKIYTLVAAVLFFSNVKSQITTFWTDSITSTSNWQMNVQTGTNSGMSDAWVLNDTEGGVAPGNCQQMLNGDVTLHITSPMAMGGAIYMPQASTHKSAQLLQGISTMGISTQLILNFDYLAGGMIGSDYSTAQYSTDGGITFNNIYTIYPTNLCGGSSHQWSNATVLLPNACNNIADLRLAFNWNNNGDGAGTNPSIAINNLKLSFQYNSTSVKEEIFSAGAIFSLGKNIIMKTEKEVNIISLSDLTGRNISFSRTGNRIEPQNIADGIYFIVAELNGAIVTKKLFLSNN